MKIKALFFGISALILTSCGGSNSSSGSSLSSSPNEGNDEVKENGYIPDQTRITPTTTSISGNLGEDDLGQYYTLADKTYPLFSETDTERGFAEFKVDFVRTDKPFPEGKEVKEFEIKVLYYDKEGKYMWTLPEFDAHRTIKNLSYGDSNGVKFFVDGRVMNLQDIREFKVEGTVIYKGSPEDVTFETEEYGEYDEAISENNFTGEADYDFIGEADYDF